MKYRVYKMIFLIFTFLMLVTSLYAFFSISDKTNTEILKMEVGSFDLDSYLFVKKNDEEEVLITNKADLDEILKRGVPGDKYTFKLRIISYVKEVIKINVKLIDLEQSSEYNVLGVNMFDMYVLAGGLVDYNNSSRYLTPKSSTPALGYEDQPLNLYRINNLITDDYLVLVSNEDLNANSKVDIIFTIEIDSNITNNKYVGIFQIGKLEVSLGG